MGHCLFLRKGEVHTAPVTYKANFADNTWAQIIDACHKNKVPATWAVGNQKTMTINGTAYAIDIIGKNHDDYADGSGKAPLTFQLHDCYNTQYAMYAPNTMVGSWQSTTMRTTYLPAILALMPSEVQIGIREVNKLTSGNGQNSTIYTTPDKLFCLSEIEVFGSLTYSKSGEGAQYSYYKEGNSKSKLRNGTGNSWWERSPRSNVSDNFCAVHASGSASYSGVTSDRGVAFGFCF